MLNFSTEFFPTADPGSLERLNLTWRALKRAGIKNYSLTFGALGANQDKSTACLEYMRKWDKDEAPVMHLTCRNQTWTKLERRLEAWSSLGVKRVLALKGDDFRARNNGPNTSAELVGFLVDHGFKASVAAYPDGHPEAKRDDWALSETEWLYQKLEAGADQVVTQFSPATDGILRLRDCLQDFDPCIGLKTGIMPIPSWERFVTLAERCGMELDGGEALLFECLPEDSHTALALGLAYANVRALIGEGLNDFHFYGLNNSRLLLPLLRSLQALNANQTKH